MVLYVLVVINIVVLKKCVCIGSIGSNASTDSLTVNLNSYGSRRKQRGKLVFFEFTEEDSTVYTISQVSQIIGALTIFNLAYTSIHLTNLVVMYNLFVTTGSIISADFPIWVDRRLLCT